MGLRARRRPRGVAPFDHDLRILQREKDLAVEQRVTQAGVEALHISVVAPKVLDGPING
jgi:hypothetical protein